uniref:G protein-coupled receptor associated sorting protein 1 n=1 Tax=Jaculus jaculus TaxID=51337 RepID=A0A8C5LAN8_JACJA
MTGAEIEPGAQAKTENKGTDEVGVAEGDNEVPMVVRPKVRTQTMTGTRPKMKSRGMPGARSKSEPSTGDVTHTNYKTKAVSSSRSKNDAQAWAQSKFWVDSKSKTGEKSSASAANCPLVGTDCGLVGKAKCPPGGRELINMDTKNFPKKKANSQMGFQPSCELEEATNIGSWCSARPVPKEETYQTSDFKWVDKPFGSAWFSSRDEGSTRFHPRKSMKASSRSRHMAKPEANPISKHKNNQEFYMISSSESDDESNKTSWFWGKEQSNPWSRSREEANNRSWFRPNREVYAESSSGSEYENQTKSWLWPGEEAKARSKLRTRKGASSKARYQTKQEICTDVMPGSNDTIKKESWLWPEEKASDFLRPKTKKETRSTLMAKEESKTKARARAKQEARSEEEALIGSWFWATEESTMVDEVSIKSSPHVEDEPIVGNWFWTEEEACVGNGTSHKSRPSAKEEQVVNFCLDTGNKNNIEIGAQAASKPMVAANDDETIVGSWFWTDEEVQPENEEENVFGSWFWGIDDPSGRCAARVSCESTPRCEEKEVTNSWFWAREVDTEAEVEEQTRSGSEEGSVFLSWFWSEKQPPVNSGAEASCDIRTGAEEEEPIIGPWFWGRVDAGVDAEVNSKSSLVDEEEPIISSWFGAGEEASIKCGVGARCKLMEEADDTDGRSCIWAEEEPCVYSPNTESLKSALEEEDSVDSWLWSKNYTRPETVVGSSWLWAAEQGNIDNETGEEIKLPTVEENIFKFWKENEKAIIEATDREESRSEAEEEDIIGPWFWTGEEDRLEAPAETREQSKIGAEEEATVGSWFWMDEPSPEAESQALEEIRSETEEEEIFASWFWAGKENNTEAEQCCESKPKDDEEMIVESWLWSEDETTEEPETVATCESKLENEERPLECESRTTDEVNSETDNGANCDNSTESEAIVGSWFWEGDETHFESNPSPVFRAICKSSSGEQDPDPSRRPQSWDEVTVKFKPGPWGRLGFPSISPFRFPKAAASLFSDMFGGKPKRRRGSSYRPEPEFPFQYDPSYRSVQEIREHLKAKERSKPDRWSCSCVQCDLRIGSEEFEELLILMDRIRDPFVHEISKIAMGMRSASPFTRDFIRDSGVVSLIEALVDYPSSRDRTSFLEDMVDVAPPYPELNIIQTYVCRVCEDTITKSLDSYEQLSGLTMIRHLTTTTDYHTLVANYMPGYLTLLETGNAKTRYHVLKVLLNLSENLAMTKELLDTEVMTEFMGLCNRKDTYDNIEVVLEIFENISKNIEKEAFFADNDIDVEPLISKFHDVKKCAKELLSK